jgi:hypothetical protein
MVEIGVTHTADYLLVCFGCLVLGLTFTGITQA